MLELKFSKYSKKFLEKCEETLFNRILSKLEESKENPFPKKCMRVEGLKEKTFRIRAGGFRILYSVLSKSNQLFIINIDKRSKVY